MLPPIESKAAYAKLDQPLFVARIRLMVVATTEGAARRQLDQLAAAFAPYTLNSAAEFRVVRDGGNRSSAAAPLAPVGVRQTKTARRVVKIKGNHL